MSLKIYADFDDYKPWSGAVETFETIERAGKLDELESLMADWFVEGCTMTELNDVLWFDGDLVLENLGLLENDDEDEEDD